MFCKMFGKQASNQSILVVINSNGYNTTGFTMKSLGTINDNGAFQHGPDYFEQEGYFYTNFGLSRYGTMPIEESRTRVYRFSHDTFLSLSTQDINAGVYVRCIKD